MMERTPDQADWHGKPYYSVDAYCKNTYGEKLYKIAVNTGLGCPNRDGRSGTGGCIFCSAGGSGDFAIDYSLQHSISDQLQSGIAFFHNKKIGNHFIAYFQAYTNTYAPAEVLQPLFREALAEPTVAGISIATRPDCLPEDIMTMLVHVRQDFPDKFIWIELGLQTIHEQTARFIRRGYPLAVYDDAVLRLKAAGFPVITHLILGLPGENPEMLLQTIDHMNKIGTWGVKLQLLHVLNGTDLGTLYQNGQYQPLDKDTYLEDVIACIARLSPGIVIHRVTGDGPSDLLLAPMWSRNKRDVLNTLHHRLKQQNVYQGCLYS